MLTTHQPIQPRVVGFPPALAAPYNSDPVVQALAQAVARIDRIEREMIALRNIEKRQVRIETRLVTLMQHHGIEVHGWSGT